MAKLWCLVQVGGVLGRAAASLARAAALQYRSVEPDAQQVRCARLWRSAKMLA